MSRMERLYAPPEIGAPGRRAARARRRDLILSGLFVLAMGLVVLAGFLVLRPGLLGDSYRLHVYFADANGLSTGMQVIEDGYAIGIVESVNAVFPGDLPTDVTCPVPENSAAPRSPLLPCFRATLRIRDAWPVPLDSQAEFASAGLLQGMAIRIIPGSAESPLAADSSLPSRGSEADIVALVAELTSTIQSVVEESVRPALASLERQIQAIEGLLGTVPGDEGSAESPERTQLLGALDNLTTLSSDLEKAVDPEQIGNILASVEALTKHLETVAGGLGQHTEQVSNTVQEYGDLAGDIRGMVAENRPTLRRTSDDAQFLVQELSASLVPILANLEDATRNLAALSREVRADPSSVIRSRKQENQSPWFE